MFLAYKYVFKPMDDEIEFYQNISAQLKEEDKESAYQKQQEQFRRESAKAKDVTQKPNNRNSLPPWRK